MNSVSSCPHQHGQDDRKSAALAAANVRPQEGAIVVDSFTLARDILRSPTMRQAGAGAEHVKLDNPEHVSVFFLDGELHRKRRSQLARYFTPKAIRERHEKVIAQTTANLIGQLQRDGKAQLDLLSMQLACDVAAEIVGLTNSDTQAMSRRIRMTFDSIGAEGGPGNWIQKATAAIRTMNFFWQDIRPAIRARQKQPKDDVISYCVQENFSNKAILIECMTYATAGMLTTREFIVMVAWHLFEKDDLRTDFLNGDEQAQLAILEEILRLEPVAAMIHRRAIDDMTGSNGEQIKAGELYAVDMRAVNSDAKATGPCPFALDPERAKRERITGAWMSFADGPHRCPGAQVALHETRIFLDALLRVPGIRLATPPTITWNAAIMGYELHCAIVECPKA